MRKTITLLLLALLTSVGAWADPTSLYERGTTTAWSSGDLADWTQSYCTATIDGGLSVNTTNAGWTCTKSISVTENSLVTLTATLKTGGASGRSGSYDYIQIGGISLRFNEQDKVASIDVDGTPTNLSLTYTRATAYNIEIVIDQSKGDVSYTCGSATGTAKSSTAITNVVFGHSKAGKENYAITTVLQKLSVSEELQEVTTADYTINYIFNNDTIKQVEGNIAVGATINADNPVSVGDVKYFAADGATTSLTVSDDADKNVLNVNLRLPNTFNYTVNAVDGSNNVLATLASGSYTEGDAAISLAYPRYILSGTTIYASGTGAVSYSTTFTPNADNYIMTIAYNSGTVNDVVYYTEGEDVSGVSEGANVRASVGKMGYTSGSESYVDVTTVEPGKYKIYLRGQNGNKDARAFNFKVGDEVVFTGSIGQGTNQDHNSEDFNVLVNSTLSFASEGSSASGVDYFYLVRTGDAEETITVAEEGTSTYVTTAALDFSNVEGLTVLIATDETQGYVELSKVTQVPAGAPIIVKGEAGDYSVPVCDATTYSDNLTNKLSGSATESYTVAAGDNIYAIKKDKSEFRPVAAGVEIPAKKAYFISEYPINADAGAKPFIIRGEEEDPTAVSTVEVVEAAKAKKFFNAAGQQVDENYKGFVITSAGKKIINK